ncbi:MAG: peptide chain release factor N(5)-glutamine methyltransferase [Bacteroidetes bacterium]|nr:peptide chain release factor N(5)-glutamine methyltransferase [Bacteroidota bacterium]
MNEKKTNSKIVFDSIRSSLNALDRDEAQAVALLLIDHFHGLSLTAILAGKEIEPKDFSPFISRLNKHEPVQYVLGYTHFFSRIFLVNPSVLIPRPETELLVYEIMKESNHSPTILDVGTGSGCIAITLKLEMPQAKVHALEVSAEALQTAQHNAQKLGATIQFFHADFLTDPFDIEPVDILVSNPPYIAQSEKRQMKENVWQYEPHRALFVPDENPLLFYKAIAEKSNQLLKPGGKIFVEINERLGEEVKKIFEHRGFVNIKMVKDLDGKNRVVVAQRY